MLQKNLKKPAVGAKVQRVVAMETIHRLILLQWCKLKDLKMLQTGTLQVTGSVSSSRHESLVETDL